MPLACPQCNQVFEQNGICPLCNVVLMYQATNLHSDALAKPVGDDDFTQWQQTPWGRILVGVILAQGLSFGLLHLMTAGFLATGDTDDPWQTLWGIALRHAIHAVSLLLGGILASASQTRGLIYGAFVGFTSGIVTFVLRDHSGQNFASPLLYIEPIMHLVIGTIGGALGMLIWRPSPKLPDLEGSHPSQVPANPWGFSLGTTFAGPVHFGRVCAGAFVVVVGVVWSEAVLRFMLRASNGSMAISSQLQAQLVTLEIAALVAVVGAAFAGATTRNGLKQGLCVGLASSVIVAGLEIGNPKFTLESVIFILSGIIAIALVGGWFGGQLFPPVSERRRRGYS
jgi:hypothetical protein